MSPDIETRRLTDPPKHNFFGYYDKCPWDESGRYVLLLGADFSDRLPEPEDEADIKIIDTETGESETVATTRAWNFQMGAMLQWRRGKTGQFLFNDREDGQFVAKLYDLQDGHVQTYNRPIYACSPDGEHAATLNYTRLHHTRPGYGYPTVGDSKVRKNAPEDDGLFVLNPSSGKSELLMSLAELASHDVPDSATEQEHWINHIKFSLDGRKIAFLHRWSLSAGGMYTRLLSYNLKTEELSTVIDSGKATHYDWRTPNEIVAWSRRGGTISESAKNGLFDLPIVRRLVNLYRRIEVPTVISQNIVGDQYHCYNLETGRVNPIEEAPNPDGHPSISEDGRWMITDTYPDEENQRHLYLVDLEEGDSSRIAAFQSSPAHDGTAYRCDLHPRWNRDNTAVCIDSMHDGTRQLYVIDLAEYVE